jgi:hypothetical protein
VNLRKTTEACVHLHFSRVTGKHFQSPVFYPLYLVEKGVGITAGAVHVGYPIHIQLQRDSRTGLFKSAATAKFASKELAQHAANTLNSREHIGMTLHVRIDTDTTVVGRAEPMVVNGSY